VKQLNDILRPVAARTAKLASLLSSLRAGEWWEYKLVPILAMFYATSLTLDASLSRLWSSLLLLLLALVPGAVYVSVINDFTDRTEDLAAGKANRLVGRSSGAIFALLATPVALGLLFVILWRHDTLLLLLYVAAWLSFTLYSVRPFRLKTRGLVGVLADAAGAHLFPTLLAVALAFRMTGRPVDPLWMGTVAVWAFAYGLRGILWHQLKDIENDRAAGVRTFVQRHPIGAVEALAVFVIFPLELIGFTLLLWQVGGLLPGVLLALYHPGS
jgi:4-hydroxybenzoate polyprenyltransferase